MKDVNKLTEKRTNKETTKETKKERQERLQRLREAAASKHAKGFVDFIREQGVVGLAVGLAMGTAAGASVKAIVDGFVSPLIGFLIGGANLATREWHTGLSRGGKDLVIAWGSVGNSILTLTATAFVIYFVIKGLKLDKLDKKKDK